MHHTLYAGTPYANLLNYVYMCTLVSKITSQSIFTNIKHINKLQVYCKSFLTIFLTYYAHDYESIR